MLIFPAIDLYERKAVRLYKGDYTQKTVYSDHPEEVALDFKRSGATHVHLVDLEGAKDGTTPNFDVIYNIKKETGLFCEVGGGVRSMEVLKRYADAGIDRIIIGTAAVTDEQFLTRAVAAYGAAIAVGVDIRDGKVAIKGWRESADIDAMEFCAHLQEVGVKTIICTDISRDGAMQGTNRQLYRTLTQRLEMQIVASGGVSSIEDVRALSDLGLYGAIIGKAYYTGDIALARAIEVAR